MAKRLNGTGSIYLPEYTDRHGEKKKGRIYKIQYTLPGGERVRISSGTANKNEATRKLRELLGEIGLGIAVSPDAAKTTFEDLRGLIVDDYKANRRQSLRVMEAKMDNLAAVFANSLAIRINERAITSYIKTRLADGAANGTINRELAHLKRAFRLAKRERRVMLVPYIPHLQEADPRSGFFERDQLEAILQHLHADLQPVVKVAYITGWRVASEILTRQWKHVSFDEGWMRLDPGESKSKEARSFPLIMGLREVLEERKRVVDAMSEHLGRKVPWVFTHLKGTMISRRWFYEEWKKAAAASGVDRIPHDFRRTAVRNLEAAGVRTKVAMQLVGHKTDAIYRRYNIVVSEDLKAGAKQLEDFLAKK